MAKKKNLKLEDAEVVSEVPSEQPEETAPEVAEDPKIDFESWFALRGEQIPAHHHKEIILADFKARKVPMEATMADFDMALKKYGIELE